MVRGKKLKEKKKGHTLLAGKNAAGTWLLKPAGKRASITLKKARSVARALSQPKKKGHAATRKSRAGAK